MAIWPSWVSAIGQASFDRLDDLGAPDGAIVAASRAAVMVPGDVMARHHSGWCGKRKAGVNSGAGRSYEEFAIAVAAGNRARG